jgi:hypothetical protein
MVRSIQTTHVNTNYIPPPRRAPVYPVVVEKVHVDLHHLHVENGVILEDSSEEILATPTPLSESQAFAARASAQALLLEATIWMILVMVEKMMMKKKRTTTMKKPVTEYYTLMLKTGHFPNPL